MSNAIGKLHVGEKDFERFGIIKNEPSAWEDGQRSDQSLPAGTYEWWYFDGHTSNGYFFAATPHLEVDSEGKNNPYLNLNISKHGEKLCDLRVPFKAESFKADKDICNVALGNSYFKSTSGLNNYEIYADPVITDGYGINIKLEKLVPTYRPGTGYWEADGQFFAWLCAVPSAKLTGTITANGKTVEVEGSGYHDHNWGNIPMDNLLDNWLWGRAEVDGITAVASSVRFNNAKGGEETNLLYLARGNEIIVDATNEEITCLEGVKIVNPDINQKISSDCIYIVENDEQTVYVRFDGQKSIVGSFPLANSTDVWDTWYTRFGAVTTVDITKHNGERIRAKANSSLEVMDFFVPKNR